MGWLFYPEVVDNIDQYKNDNYFMEEEFQYGSQIQYLFVDMFGVGSQIREHSMHLILD